MRIHLSHHLVFRAALTFALLIEVALLVRTVLALKNVEKGFDTRNLLTLRIDLPQPKYADARGSARFFDELTWRLEQIPGIEAAAATSRLPIADREVPVRFSIEGRPPSTPEAQQWAAVASVTAGYLRTMRIPLLRGRDLDRIDSAAAAPTVLISRLAASRYWPQEDPIGKRIRLENGNDREWSEIVGVVGDVRNSDPGEAPVPQIYVPHSRRSEREMAVVVRTSGDRAALVAAIRAEVLRLDRDQAIYDVATIERLLFDGMAGTYVLAAMMVALAVIALAVAAAGMYGVIAHAVAQRTHEIGIRMALGAEAAAVRRMVMVHGLTLVVIGAGIGLGLGLALVRITAAALHEVKPADPAAYVGVTAVLASVALLASHVPAHRATRIDPLAALRVE